MEQLDASLRAVLAARAKLDAALDAQTAALKRRVAAAKEQWNEMNAAAAAPPGTLPKTVKLNVGGDATFAVSRETIMRSPSRLAQMFSGRWDHMLPRDSNGRFFLDLDSCQMRAIFNWLTDLTRVAPDGRSPPHPRERLPDEHKWGIDELMLHLRLTASDVPGPGHIASDLEGDAQPFLVSEDEDGVLGAATVLSELVASCALQADKDERQVQARRAALDEERTFVEQYAAAFRTEGSIVPLNVSGVSMATARATLLQERDSMLAAKFGPGWRLQEEELVDGGVSLEADPAAFAHMLQYLRLQRLGVPALGPLPPQAAQGAVLQRLLDYYGISMKRRRLFDSVIMTPEQQLQIAAWLPQAAHAELLFRASRDSFRAAAFHARCDKQGDTLVVALSAGGYRFGGFADAPWTSPARGAYRACLGSFLFGLGGPEGEEPPARYDLKPAEAERGIWNRRGSGPTFGEHSDLHVHSGAGSCQCSFSPTTYQLPSADSGASPLAEGNLVTLADYEVFRIA